MKNEYVKIMILKHAKHVSHSVVFARALAPKGINIVDLRRFDSSIILILKGGILMSIGVIIAPNREAGCAGQADGREPWSRRVGSSDVILQLLYCVTIS